MKTKEELNALRDEVETIIKKCAELTEDELVQVTGGTSNPPCGLPFCQYSSRESCMYLRSSGGRGIKCKYN